MVAAMEKREQDAHTYLNRFGPPNLLLVNRGGKFSVAPEAAQLAEWLNTFQCSWADYDDDGDQDAYICNDFAPDHLYRNDGSGHGRHREIHRGLPAARWRYDAGIRHGSLLG